MIFFLLFFLLIYGSLHLYLLIKIKMILQPTIHYIIPIIFFLFLMIAMPIFTSRLLKTNQNHITVLLYYIGYSWMALLFLFISISLIFDLILAIIYIIQHYFNKDFLFSFPKIYILILPAFLSIIVFIYGYYEGKNIKIEKIEISTNKLPAEIKELSIVQISDVHLGTVIKGKRFENIVNILKEIDADILVSTGDMLDRTYINKNKIDLLNKIKPKYGKYAVLGNHEYYIGTQSSIDFKKASNFKVLRNEAYTIDNIINIIGIDDKLFRNENEEVKIKNDFNTNLFTVVLKHRPETENFKFDLLLSGHTHKGQIFPASIIIKILHKYDAGLFDLKDNGKLYVNRGTGLWGPPIRLFSPPEITLFIINKNNH
jgi:uncharacterized protein